MVDIASIVQAIGQAVPVGIAQASTWGLPLYFAKKHQDNNVRFEKKNFRNTVLSGIGVNTAVSVGLGAVGVTVDPTSLYVVSQFLTAFVDKVQAIFSPKSQ